MEKDKNTPEEHYDENEPTPADEVVTTSEGTFILRMGEAPIKIDET